MGNEDSPFRYKTFVIIIAVLDIVSNPFLIDLIEDDF